GHVKVGPDGTAYVPTADCDGHQALAETTNEGLTWSVEEIPGSTTQDESDPHLGIGPKGTLYLGWQGGDGADLGNKGYFSDARSEGRAWISVKAAGSNTWRPPIDVGASLGIKNIQFPEVFAGDDSRAAYAFLGTTTAGDDQDPSFRGVWHVYVAYTYDGGQTWTTVDATPTDPVQRGCIWLQGGSNPCRNLLDFMGSAIDKEGRVLIGYADGCTGVCADGTGNTKTKLATIARQVNGERLFAAYDPPAAPVLTASADAQQPATIHLSWTPPQGRSAPVSGYNIDRRPASSDYTLLASVGNVNNYDDTRGGTQYTIALPQTANMGTQTGADISRFATLARVLVSRGVTTGWLAL